MKFGFLAIAVIGMLYASHGAEAKSVERIVTLGSAITEVVFALGAGGKVIGTDTTSIHPQAALSLPKTGYIRGLSLEGILSLRPDLVIASEDAGPPQVLQQLANAKIPVTIIRGKNDLQGLKSRILEVGQILESSEEASLLWNKIDHEIADIQVRLPGDENPKVLILLSTGGGLQAAGQKSAAEEILLLAGARNAVKGYDGYRLLNDEAALAAAPDIIILATASSVISKNKEAPIPAILQRTPAGRNNRIYSFDAVDLLGFGPRLPEILRRLTDLLHPVKNNPILE